MAIVQSPFSEFVDVLVWKDGAFYHATIIQAKLCKLPAINHPAAMFLHSSLIVGVVWPNLSIYVTHDQQHVMLWRPLFVVLHTSCLFPHLLVHSTVGR